MKKLIFVLFLLCFIGVVPVADAQGYDLQEALKNIDVEPEDHPVHLPGTNPKPGSVFAELRESEWTGKPYIITFYIQRIANALTGLAAAVAVLFIVQNSFNLLTSAGDSEKVTTSKKGLMWALIGLVVIMGAYIVVKTVISLSYVGGSVESGMEQMDSITRIPNEVDSTTLGE